MKKIVIGLVVIIAGLGAGYYVGLNNTYKNVLSPVGSSEVAKPYLAYSFENLVNREDKASKIQVSGNVFYYESEGRRISGEVNRPTGLHPVGIVVMARGYVDKEDYKTGVGTHNAAVYFAKHGYITYAPDFSGYGASDAEDPDPIGARLVKPVEILDLIASINDGVTPIYLWGHSNGGQIMLSVAEVLGRRHQLGLADLRGYTLKGVTLWAPVSKPFPYNILYYTDEASDSGKWLRGQVANFEQEYDVFDYSIDRYMDWIELPVQLHQGTADESVPVTWSNELAKNLEELDKEINYYKYLGADHNLRPSWDTVVERDVEWFDQLEIAKSSTRL